MLIAQNATVLWTALWQALGLDVFAGDAYVRPNGTAGLTLSAVSTAVIAPVCEELPVSYTHLPPAGSRAGTDPSFRSGLF